MSIIGLKSTGCETDCDKVCYEPCAHTTAITDFISSSIARRDPLLMEYVLGILNTHELFLQEVCGFTFDICTLGLLRGFPCVQCYPRSTCIGLSKDLPDGCDTFTVVESTDVGCTSFDFQETAEGQELYQSIIDALSSEALVNSASVLSVDNFIKLVWPDSFVALFFDSTFFVNLGRAPTALELEAKNIIARAIPLPLGSGIEFVV